MENKNKKYTSKNTTINVGNSGFSQGVMWGNYLRRHDGRNYVFFNPDESQLTSKPDSDMRVPLEVILDEWLESLSPERQRELELLETKRKEEVELKSQKIKEDYEKYEKRLNKFLLKHKSLEVDELEEKIKSLEKQLKIELDRVCSLNLPLSKQYQNLKNQIYVLEKLVRERLDSVEYVS